jgi:hypothetical protein
MLFCSLYPNVYIYIIIYVCPYIYLCLHNHTYQNEKKITCAQTNGSPARRLTSALREQPFRVYKQIHVCYISVSVSGISGKHVTFSSCCLTRKRSAPNHSPVYVEPLAKVKARRACGKHPEENVHWATQKSLVIFSTPIKR